MPIGDAWNRRAVSVKAACRKLTGRAVNRPREPPPRPLIGSRQFEGEQLVIAEIPELDPARRPCFCTEAGMTKGSLAAPASAPCSTHCPPRA